MADLRLQNLHHRFDSGRRLQRLSCKWALFRVRRAPISFRIGKTADILPTRFGSTPEPVRARGSTLFEHSGRAQVSASLVLSQARDAAYR
jgi:hypothetical protein